MIQNKRLKRMAILLIIILSIKVINLGMDLYRFESVNGLAKAKVIKIQKSKNNEVSKFDCKYKIAISYWEYFK